MVITSKHFYVSYYLAAFMLRKILSDEDILYFNPNHCRETILQIMVTTKNKESSNCDKIGFFLAIINTVENIFSYIRLFLLIVFSYYLRIFISVESSSM